MKNDFELAFNEISENKGLPKEVVLEAIEAAMASAYRRSVNASNAQQVEAKINPETGKVSIFAEKEVVEDVQDQRTEVILAEAQKVDPEANLGSMVMADSTPSNFGRVAAQTARQVIQQRIREAERQAQFDYYSKQVGEIVNGIVQSVTAKGVSLGMELKAEGIMPRNQQLPREHFRVHDRIRALLFEIKTTPRGPQIILSRSHRDFLRRLLENEVPEIYHGMVEVRSISREPGYRSKVAVAGMQAGVDPVGACVGIRGVRIQAIVRELNDEKIDVIEWSPDPAIYIAKAISPARVLSVYLDENPKGPKTATVIVPEDQLSLAIGRDGQNARLAAKLTGWRIDIKSLPEATSEVLFKLHKNPEYAHFYKQEEGVIRQIEAILSKKSERRPITPEEYSLMGSFVDRVEQGVVQRRQTIKKEHGQRLQAAQEAVPEAAYELPIFALGLTKRVAKSLTEAEYTNVGDLMLQVYFDPAIVLEVSGIGDKTLEKIKATFEALILTVHGPEPEEKEAPVTEDASQEPAAEIAAEPEVVESEGKATEELTIEEKVVAEAEVATTDGEIELETLGEADEAEEFLQTKKKKKKYVDVEYDPDQDVMIYKKKRKGVTSSWENWEDDLDS
ncbi:MAG: transcription termination factor NusA [Chloroflexi bacterium]|nr:transcription termination factor NusA [Chloroflexota bacterium]